MKNRIVSKNVRHFANFYKTQRLDHEEWITNEAIFQSFDLDYLVQLNNGHRLPLYNFEKIPKNFSLQEHVIFS